jgi:hypothetical protein
VRHGEDRMNKPATPQVDVHACGAMSSQPGQTVEIFLRGARAGGWRSSPMRPPVRPASPRPRQRRGGRPALPMRCILVTGRRTQRAPGNLG